eukprot:INCI7498.3.p2 GENE.INCI7498.3~~INCI7498.3.p2  ORF type:complete len:129 (+),score=18.85 INCI7498.3:176-562(+)
MAEESLQTSAETRPDPKRDADEYIAKHNLLKLFQDLGTLLVYNRPDDPRAFLLEKLVQFQSNRGVLPFFTQTDATAMFGMFDRTNSGSITPEQYEQALKCLDIKSPQPVTSPVSLQQFLELTEEATRN